MSTTQTRASPGLIQNGLKITADMGGLAVGGLWLSGRPDGTFCAFVVRELSRWLATPRTTPSPRSAPPNATSPPRQRRPTAPWSPPGSPPGQHRQRRRAQPPAPGRGSSSPQAKQRGRTSSPRPALRSAVSCARHQPDAIAVLAAVKVVRPAGRHLDRGRRPQDQAAAAGAARPCTHPGPTPRLTFHPSVLGVAPTIARSSGLPEKSGLLSSPVTGASRNENRATCGAHVLKVVRSGSFTSADAGLARCTRSSHSARSLSERPSHTSLRQRSPTQCGRRPSRKAPHESGAAR
jgi:hypothetical protein